MWISRADSRFVLCQWETSLQCNAVSHWLGTNLESALISLMPQTAKTASIGNSVSLISCGWRQAAEFGSPYPSDTIDPWQIFNNNSCCIHYGPWNESHHLINKTTWANSLENDIIINIQCFLTYWWPMAASIVVIIGSDNVACSVPSHYLTECGCIAIGNIWNKYR